MLPGLSDRLLVPSFKGRERTLSAVWVATIGLEAILGLWLVSGWERPYALTVAASFFVLALGCVVWALVKAKGSRCGCFGSKARNSGWVALRCASLATLGMWAGLWAKGSGLGLLQWTVIAVCCAGVVAPWLAESDELGSHFRQAGHHLMFARLLLCERLSGGPDVRSMTEALAAVPYWQELTKRLQLRGPRRVWREGPWLLMEHVPRDTNDQVLVVSASCEGTNPLWLRVAVLSSSGKRVELDSLWDSVAARADDNAKLVEMARLESSSSLASRVEPSTARGN